MSEPKPCTTCKSNPVQTRTGRKFTECYDCRVARIKEALAARKSKRAVSGCTGGLVQYYDCGWRYGYLVGITPHMAIIQPIAAGDTLARHVRITLGDVKPAGATSATLPTLKDYVASKPKVEQVAAPIIATDGDVLATTGDQVLTMHQPRGIVTNFDTAKAVELYRAGMKIIDIAVQMGYARGQGNNRTRKALREAGVLQ